MIRTLLRVYHLPQEYWSFETNLFGIPEGQAEELLAYMRGEEVCAELFQILPSDLRRNLEEVGGEAKIGEVMHLVSGKDDVEPAGWRTPYCRASLRRLFHFADDFCETYPDKTEIVLPFTSAEIDAMVYGLLRREGSLSAALDCLRYLNPKDNTLFFRYEPKYVPDAVLLDLASKITPEERRQLLEGRWDAYPLPLQGLSWDVIGCVFETHDLSEAALRIFAKYPRYLVQYVQRYAGRGSVMVKLLLTESFCNEPDTIVQEQESFSLPRYGTIFIWLLSAPGTTWEQMGRLFAMLGLRSNVMENEKLRVRSPAPCFNCDILRSIRVPDESEKIIAHMLKVCPRPLSHDEASSVIFTHD